MNIKILDSWLRDYLKTDATAKEIAQKLSLTSVSIERVEKKGDDYVYDIEVTTNRPDLASVVGLAREAAAVIPGATFLPPKLSEPRKISESLPLTIDNDPKLVNRVCAVVLDVQVKESPQYIKERLEASEIRSLNNLIDITNYVMRTIGHPTHVFDYDRIHPKKISIRESKKGEKITTLDEKTLVLPGGDIIADNGEDEIIDLLGIMGLENSVVTNDTKRIIFFIDNNDPKKMRDTSMSLGIRSEAVQLNEKGIDPELAYDAFLFGIKLYEELADGKVVSKIIDIYPNKPKIKKVSITEEKIASVIGVDISLKESAAILKKLGFEVETIGNKLIATVPSIRAEEVSIPEDLIEEIARVYGYHNLPSILPPMSSGTIVGLENEYYWIKRVKNALKYWGFTETYTYSMVSEALFEGPLRDAVALKNPLSVDWEYMRVSLIPSMLQIVAENKKRKTAYLFELANVYEKTAVGLPNEILHLAGIIKKPNASFFEVKGLLEQLLLDLGIEHASFNSLDQGSREIAVKIGSDKIGEIELLDDDLIDFELDFNKILRHATIKKTFTPLAKYPPVIEDISFILADNIPTADIIKTIQDSSKFIEEVQLIDRYKDSRTFRVTFRDPVKNLSARDAEVIRNLILKSVKEKFRAIQKT
jgi:phenylalanyl-tRNA synthetase beta chain